MEKSLENNDTTEVSRFKSSRPTNYTFVNDYARLGKATELTIALEEYPDLLDARSGWIGFYPGYVSHLSKTAYSALFE